MMTIKQQVSPCRTARCREVYNIHLIHFHRNKVLWGPNFVDTNGERIQHNVSHGVLFSRVCPSLLWWTVQKHRRYHSRFSIYLASGRFVSFSARGPSCWTASLQRR